MNSQPGIPEPAVRSHAATQRRAGGWFGTLKVRLMVASTLVIAASVGVTTSVVLQRVQQRSEQALLELERDSAERMAGMLGQRVAAMQGLLKATAAALPEAARTDPAAGTAYLDTLPALMTVFRGISIADASGRILALRDGNSLLQPALDVKDRPYFRQAMQGLPAVSLPFKTRLHNMSAITLAMPIVDAEQRVVGVLCGWVNLEGRNLFDDIAHGVAGNPGRVLTVVTDGRGTIVSHPQRQLVMRPIGSEPAVGVMAARWMAQTQPLRPAAVAVHEQGHFVSMVGVPDAGWVLFRATSDVNLLGGLAQAREQAMWWAGGVALAGGLLLLALLAVLLGPLSRLRQRALALQDPSLPVDQGWPAARGEIGELSRVLQRVLRERAVGERASQLLAQQMGSVLAAAPIGIGFTRQQRFELAGAEFSALLGRPDGEVVGCSARQVFACAADAEGLGAEVSAAFSSGQPYFGERQFTRGDGSSFWGRLQGRAVDPADSSAGVIWLLEDVTEHRQVRERLSWSASHDALTRLFNRGTFVERLTLWLAQPDSGRPATLLWLDLDRFKQVNDSAGHAAGDDVLRDVAAALQSQVRGGDTAARLGGDEFALLLPGCVAEVAMQLGERLRAAIAQVGVDHDGLRLSVGVSIGVVQIDAAAGLSAAAWLALADAACYEAKHAGRNCVRMAAATTGARSLAGVP